MRIAACFVLSLLAACTDATVPPASPDGGSGTTTGAVAAGTVEPDAVTANALKEAKKAIPQGSGDYSEILADGILYQRGRISFDDLERRVLARKLPPHPLGDGYLEMTPPPPPPGVTFDNDMMPPDWVGTWGEVRQLAYSGKISKEQYDALHAKAHPACK
jgi:hypothetical protein